MVRTASMHRRQLVHFRMLKTWLLALNRILASRRIAMALTYTRHAARPCPRCGINRSPIAYARAKEVTVYHPDYDDLEGECMVAAYQEDQLKIFRRLMDYDKILAWA